MRHMAFPNTHPVGVVTLTTVYRLNEGSDWSRHPRQLTLTTRLPVGRSGSPLCGGYLQARTVVALLLGDSTFADAMTQYGYLLPTLGLKPFPIDSCKAGHQKQNPETLCWGMALGMGNYAVCQEDLVTTQAPTKYSGVRPDTAGCHTDRRMLP
jgi:hypothetical protein